MANAYKVYVADGARLEKKYGKADADKIHDAVTQRASTEAQRFGRTEYVQLNDSAQMSALGAPALPAHPKDRHYKDLVDAVWDALMPSYLVIIGADDAFPHQSLSNPLRPKPSQPSFPDPDKRVLSDLPYACAQKYSRHPRDYTGPTRVVGRIPDIFGSNNPAYLLALLRADPNRAPQPASTYRDIFAISAEKWLTSTSLTLHDVLGAHATIRTCPQEGPNWTVTDMRPLTHYINCHGTSGSSTFQGEGDTNLRPVAVDATNVERDAVDGTVVIAECCYGAELFLPRPNPPIANAYLERGAHCVVGSTTTSFGAEDKSDHADLLCGAFLGSLLEGKSTGEALLVARQRYVVHRPSLDPTDLKTLAQFILLGDPSAHPVGDSQTLTVAHRTRPMRRADARIHGVASRAVTAVSAKAASAPSDSVRAELERIAEEWGLVKGEATYQRFDIGPPPNRKLSADAGRKNGTASVSTSACYLICGSFRAPDAAPMGGDGKPQARTIFISVLEVDGRLTERRVSYAKSATAR